MRKKVFFLIGILLIIAVVIMCFQKAEGTPIEEFMKNREWVSKEEKLRGLSMHDWVVSEKGEIRCNHCEKIYEVGETFNYTPEINKDKIKLSKELTGYDKIQIVTAEDATWIVLGATTDGKGLLITTDKPINEKDNIKFKGLEGYNNGIGILNTICRELYSNSEYGFARNMTIEDINQCLGFTNPTEQYSYLETIYEDGETTEKELWEATGYLTTKLKDIPLFQAVADNGTYSPKGDIGPKSLGDYYLEGYTLQLLEKAENGTYNIEALGLGLIFEAKEKRVNFIFGKEENYTYWLASRGTTLSEDCVNFGIGMVKNKKATTWSRMYDSTGKATEKNSADEETGLRPVVELYIID